MKTIKNRISIEIIQKTSDKIGINIKYKEHKEETINMRVATINLYNYLKTFLREAEKIENKEEGNKYE